MDNELHIPREDARLLIAAAQSDAALLYLALKTGLPAPLSPEQLRAAENTLARLGLTETKKPPVAPDEPPVYSTETIHRALHDADFSALLGEVQRILGRVIPTEELRSLLCIRDHLQMPDEVISILVSYCVQRCRARGRRMPSLREIEREAFAWTDQGVDSVETAARYMQAMLARQSRQGQIAGLLQISGRHLVRNEENYISQWIAWGFPDEAISLAYEKTCLNAGGLKWPYLHSILKSWHEQGLHTVAEIRQGDRGGKKAAPVRRELDDLDREAISRLLKED